jgi:hypothetical protein
LSLWRQYRGQKHVCGNSIEDTRMFVETVQRTETCLWKQYRGQKHVFGDNTEDRNMFVETV